jgi:hypothetical protein
MLCLHSLGAVYLAALSCFRQYIPGLFAVRLFDWELLLSQAKNIGNAHLFNASLPKLFTITLMGLCRLNP